MKMDKHYLGHRERVKEKLFKAPKSFQKYEILEALLFYSIPRKDVKPIAKELLNKFGSLHGILKADAKALTKINNITLHSAALFKIASLLVECSFEEKIMDKPVLNNWLDAMKYCHFELAQNPTEIFKIIYLNTKNEIMAEENVKEGGIDSIAISTREIAKKILDKNAKSVVFIHNHPSGDLTPSQEDISFTQEMNTILQKLDIKILDHIIVSKSGYFSLKKLRVL